MSEYPLIWKTCFGSDRPHIGPMRSLFAFMRLWFLNVSGALTTGVEALEGILGHMRALVEAMERFERRESADVDPEQHNHMNVLDAKISDLTLAVSEGVNNVQRSERRVRAVVTSARRELAEAGYSHAGLEAEGGQLRDLDAESGNGEQVPAVPEVVDEPDQAQHSVVPGVSVRQMQLARARRR